MIFEKIHIKQWVRSCFSASFTDGKRNAGDSRDDGFLMLSMVALILLLGAAYTSFAFVEKKNFNWNLNYALGQQYAQVAAASHLFVQTVAYDLDYSADPRRNIFLNGAGGGGNEITIADLILEGFLPAGFTVNQNKYEDLTITAYADLAPRGSPNQAATAFVVVDLDVDQAGGRLRTGADIAAFRAGAASKGLSRLGIPVLTTSAQPCGVAGTSFVRWGDNPGDCLTQADVDGITDTVGFAVNLDQHDAIAPAWEAAAQNQDQNALYRYPQPGRPDAQIMTTNIDFDGGGTNHGITGTRYLDTETLTVAAQMNVNNPDPASNNPDNSFGALVVSDPSTLVGSVVIEDDLSVDTASVSYDDPGTVGTDTAIQIGTAGTPSELNIINGGLNEEAGYDTSVNITQGAGELGIITLLQEQDTADGMTINVEDNNDLVVTGTISHAGIAGASTFAVQDGGTSVGNLQAPFADVQVCSSTGCGDLRDVTLSGDSASAEITVDTMTVDGGTFESLTIESAGGVTVGGEVNIEFDCFGLGCPDAVTDDPDSSILDGG